MKLEYTERALEEIDLAMSWYELQRQGLGLQFLDCIEVTVLSVIERPLSFPVKHQEIRGAIVRRFPFSVYFVVEESKIVVQAIFDNRQHPDKRP